MVADAEPLSDLDLDLGDGFVGDDLEARAVRADVSRRLFSHSEPSVRIGRYVVLKKIGVGGRGIVFAAYDPQLDRNVALKVVRPEILGSARERKRLLREAHTLARLSHPNVVQVHDAGELGDDVFIAMELVEGRSCDEWLRSESHSWRQVLEVFIQAGRGLAAAHSAGLVHRDFKPRNFLVGDDGRVRVVDFGLARPSGAHKDATNGTSSPVTTSGDGDTSRIGGTPPYIAPEHLDGGAAAAPADQFSFCVALHEGLYQRRPFPADDSARRSRDLRRSARVPRWLHRIVIRGLSVDPNDRFPSMQLLLTALSRGRQRARFRRTLVVLAILALAVVGMEGWQRAQVAATESECLAAADSVSEVWDDQIRARVREALVATGAPYARTTADKLIPRLEAYAHNWKAARLDACLDTRTRDVWDEDTLERSTWCLDAARMDLEAVIARLSVADPSVSHRAMALVMGLPRIEPCRDPRALDGLPVPPPDRRVGARDLKAELARARTVAEAGEYHDGLKQARAILARIDDLEWPPLTAEAALTVGRLLDETGQLDEAEQLLIQAYFGAEHVGATDSAYGAAVELVDVVGRRRGRTAEASLWARHAESHLRRIESSDGLRTARLLAVVAQAERVAGRPDRAEALGTRVLNIRERELGPGHPKLASMLVTLGNAKHARGRYQEAEQLYRRALVITESALGRQHPRVAKILNNLAVVCKIMGASEDASAHYERALAIREQLLPGHPEVARTLVNLATLEMRSGRLARAQGLLERALTILDAAPVEHPELSWAALIGLANVRSREGEHAAALALYTRARTAAEATLPPDHPNHAHALIGIANMHQAMGRSQLAIELHRRALAFRERILGPRHPDVARQLANLADASYEGSADASAKALFERALAILERRLGVEHPDLRVALIGLGEVELALGRVGSAIERLERALALSGGEIDRTDRLPRTRFALARALRAAGRDPDRALELAGLARDTYRDHGRRSHRQLAAVERWLSSTK